MIKGALALACLYFFRHSMCTVTFIQCTLKKKKLVACNLEVIHLLLLTHQVTMQISDSQKQFLPMNSFGSYFTQMGPP